jgi:cytochrome c peroxidase
VLADWNEINAYMKTIRSPFGRTVFDGDPDNGRLVFETFNCHFCHGGPLWTLSQLYYTPTVDEDLRTETFSANGITSLGNVSSVTIALKANGSNITIGDFLIDGDPGGVSHRHACVVRRVGTFDADGPDARGAAEIRQNGNGAQGTGGFNVPSLLNMATGAPYFHNGAVETLDELLDSAEFDDHLRAANVVSPLDDQDRADLVAFLQSIDEFTETIDVPANQIICPAGVNFTD